MSIRPEEFVCPCCGGNEVSRVLVEKVRLVRTSAATSFIVTSGWRCEKHNLEVGGKGYLIHGDSTVERKVIKKYVTKETIAA